MATPTETLAMAAMERIQAQLDKDFLGMFTTNMEQTPQDPITSDTLRGWNFD